MRRLNHPCIVKIFDILEPEDRKNFKEIFLVLELADSDLKKVLNSISLDIQHIKTIVYNILVGIKYMHSASVLHRDLKPANILLNEDCSIKICDFGLSRCVI